MQNKIESIDGSISMCYKFLKGETVELNGLHKMTFGRKEETTNEQIYSTIDKLMLERDNLQMRVNRFNQPNRNDGLIPNQNETIHHTE